MVLSSVIKQLFKDEICINYGLSKLFSVHISEKFICEASIQLFYIVKTFLI